MCREGQRGAPGQVGGKVDIESRGCLCQTYLKGSCVGGGEEQRDRVLEGDTAEREVGQKREVERLPATRGLQ